MITFRGAVVGCAPTAAGPKGLARWRNDSVSAILVIQMVHRWDKTPDEFIIRKYLPNVINTVSFKFTIFVGWKFRASG